MQDSRIIDNKYIQIDITKFLVKFNNAAEYRKDEVYNQLSQTEKENLEKIVQSAIEVYDQTPK